jgi:hypothetical protein
MDGKPGRFKAEGSAASSLNPNGSSEATGGADPARLPMATPPQCLQAPPGKPPLGVLHRSNTCLDVIGNRSAGDATVAGKPSFAQMRMKLGQKLNKPWRSGQQQRDWLVSNPARRHCGLCWSDR